MKTLDPQHMLETLQMAYLYILDEAQLAVRRTRQAEEDTNTRLTKDQQKELVKRLFTYWADYDKKVVSNRRFYRNELVEELRGLIQESKS